MMAKENFEQLADALRGCHPQVLRPALSQFSGTFCDLEEQWEECVDAVAAACAVSNPQFDYTKFTRRAGR